MAGDRRVLAVAGLGGRVKVVAHHLVRPAQEQAGGYPRCARSSARHLFIDRLADTRDLAILLLAFAGRRRSEVARPAVPLDPRDPKSPCLAIQLGRTKTGDADEAGRVLLVEPPVEALREWLIGRPDPFPGHRSMGSGGGEAATPRSIDLIVKRRCMMAGARRRSFPRMDCVRGI